MTALTAHQDLAIVAIGMATPLGVTAAGACAASRAGIMRISPVLEFEVFDEENLESVPVAAHVTTNYTDGFTGLGRLARLGQLALQDLRANAPWESDDTTPTGFLVSVTDGYLEHEYLDRSGEHGPEGPDADRRRWLDALEEHLLPNLTAASGVTVEPESIRLIPDGAAGFVAALREADRFLESGAVERCIVGAIDSRSDPAFIPALIGLDLLKTPSAPSRAIPGEAAAFVIVERGRVASERGHATLATIGSSALTKDTCDLLGEEVSDGRALASVICECSAAASASGSPVGLLIGDIDGNERRSQDLGHAIIRLPEEIRNVPFWTTGEGFGSVGAATPAVATCLGVRAFARGYAPTAGLIAFASGEDGARVALHLAAEGGTRATHSTTSNTGIG